MNIRTYEVYGKITIFVSAIAASVLVSRHLLSIISSVDELTAERLVKLADL